MNRSMRPACLTFWSICGRAGAGGAANRWHDWVCSQPTPCQQPDASWVDIIPHTTATTCLLHAMRGAVRLLPLAVQLAQRGGRDLVGVGGHLQGEQARPRVCEHSRRRQGASAIWQRGAVCGGRGIRWIAPASTALCQQHGSTGTGACSSTPCTQIQPLTAHLCARKGRTRKQRRQASVVSLFSHLAASTSRRSSSVYPACACRSLALEVACRCTAAGRAALGTAGCEAVSVPGMIEVAR